MRKVLTPVFWILFALLGAFAYAVLACKRGEPVNSAYLVIAAICTYVIGYRFYSKWIAARVLAVNDRRATPCEVHDDGKDFVRTHKWIVFGHHFAAISGPGPLVGPVLAAQFGYLPSALWILIGVVLGGAVQDFVVLFCSMRRDGKSLGQMVKEELNTTAGFIALVAILAILTILLAVLALVVVRALAESPWGVFTVAATVPIALFMGGHMRFLRVGRVMEASAIGSVLLLAAVWGGKLVHENAFWAHVFGLTDIQLAWGIIIYGVAASVLPVWLLLAPRDYLSTFVKLGTIFLLVLGILVVLPDLKMPAITAFADGSGLVMAGKLFPFCFITIACGAISGFHTLIASGTTPKIITRESYARSIGYGAMCLESLVAIMALIAACTLEPGVYLAMNMKGAGATPDAVEADTISKIQKSGFTAVSSAVIRYEEKSFTLFSEVPLAALPETTRQLRADGKAVIGVHYPQTPVIVSKENMAALADEVGEKSLFGRTGGAATLAVGMAKIFSNLTNGRWLDLWYHFAIMFEALFILTTIDAGTRVGRYILQDFLGHLWKPLGDTRKLPSNLLASMLLVGAWGWFLIQGVRDPLGGINSLWPLFGIANQMLAAIALCLGTTILLKMQLSPSTGLRPPLPPAGQKDGIRGRPAFALITVFPLVWLLAVTFTAGAEKVWSADPRLGFNVAADAAGQKREQLRSTLASVPPEELPARQKEIASLTKQIFNLRLDAVVAIAFLGLVSVIVLISLREWVLLLLRRRAADLHEADPVWLPDYALKESGPSLSSAAGAAAIAVGLAKELSGESQFERARQNVCACEQHSDRKVFAQVTEERFNGVRRCC